MTRTLEAASSSQRLRRIEGRHNALVKDLRQAFARAERTEAGDCAVEGLRIVEEATRSGLRFKAVFFKETAQNMAERLLPQIGANVDTLLLPDKLFDSVVPSETPQGVAALVRLKDFSLEDVLERTQLGPIVIVAGLQDPGNLGTNSSLGRGLRQRRSYSRGRNCESLQFKSDSRVGGIGVPTSRCRGEKCRRTGRSFREATRAESAVDCDVFAQGYGARSGEPHRAVGNFCRERGGGTAPRRSCASR